MAGGTVTEKSSLSDTMKLSQCTTQFLGLHAVSKVLKIVSSTLKERGRVGG
jgi:hypothetical protein